MRVARKRDVPHRTIGQRLWEQLLFLDELSFLREDLDAIVRAVAHVHEAVVGELGAVHRRAELLRERLLRIVAAERRVVRLVAVRAPVALDLARVHVDHGHALVEVAVRHVRLVGLRVDEDLGDAAEVVHVVTVGHGLAVHHARTLLAEHPDELALARELQDVRVGTAVAANPHVALVVHDDAVVRVRPVGMKRRPAPAVHDVAGLIEGDDRRRRIAAFAHRVVPGA